MSSDPLRIGNDLLDSLLTPYVGKCVLLHFACEGLMISWKRRGVLRPSPLGAWHPWRIYGAGGFEEAPFGLPIGYECFISIIPEPEAVEDRGVEDLINQARSLADLLQKVKKA